MGIRRGPGTMGILLAACMGFAGTAYAACTGPQALTAKLRAHPTADNAILLGSWFAGHHQFDCATETFRGALRRDPKSAQLHYLLGLAIAGAGHPAEAMPDLAESVRLDPNVIKPHLMLAYLYDEAGQHAKAEEQWKQALAIDPHSATALEGESEELLGKQDYADVVLLLKNAPRSEKLAINLSKALGMLNYLDQANAVLTEALHASPNSIPLASAMTVVLVKQQRYQDAINLLQQAVQDHPGNVDVQVQLFRVLVLTNHINLARPMAPRLLAERPHDSEVLYLSGIVDRSVGDYVTAKAHLEQAVAIDPNFFNSRYNLGMVLDFLHEWKEAAIQLQKAIDLGAPQPEVHFELAKALNGLGERDQALVQMKQYQQIKKAEEADLEAASAAAQGDTALGAGKVKEAIGFYKAATAGAPGNATYKYKLAMAFRQDQDTDDERAQLEEAIKLDPRLAAAQRELGYLLSRSGDSAGAIAHFRLAVQAAPGWVDAWINLAGELAENGRYAEARQATATALHLDPANTEAHELSDELARDPAAQQAQP